MVRQFVIFTIVFLLSANTVYADGEKGSRADSNERTGIKFPSFFMNESLGFDSFSLNTPLNPPSRGVFTTFPGLIPPLRGAQGGVANLRFDTNLLYVAHATKFEAAQEKLVQPQNRSAFLKSLVVPGWGQYSLRAKSSARNFLISEILLIGTSIGFRVYSNWLKDDFSAYAAQHAAVTDIENKNDQFWVDVGNFESINDFNDEKLRQRNTRDLRDPNSDEFWQWDSAENRTTFEDLRIRKDRASERSSFMIAGIVANHVISAVHALWLTKKARGASAFQQPKIRFVWEDVRSSNGGKIKVSYRF